MKLSEIPIRTDRSVPHSAVDIIYPDGRRERVWFDDPGVRSGRERLRDEHKSAVSA
jgi:hypothetical protein